MPLSRHAVPADSRQPSAIVFVNDPEAKIGICPELLGQVYDLTGAESRLAEHLIQGQSLVHAAESPGVRHNTARTHLQRIYEKTGTGHQGELVRLLLTGLGNLLPAEPGKIIRLAADQVRPNPPISALQRRGA